MALMNIAKIPGKVANCKYVTCKEDIPQFLMDDQSVHADDQQIIMYCVDGNEPAIRPYPVFLKWELASEEKKSTLIHEWKGERVYPNYGTWPKDNGFDTLNHAEDGTCYSKDAEIKPLRAAVVSDQLPELDFGTMEVTRESDNQWSIVTSWGERRYGTIGEAIFVEYAPGNINIVALSESSATEYYVFDDKLNNIGMLVDYLAK